MIDAYIKLMRFLALSALDAPEPQPVGGTDFLSGFGCLEETASTPAGCSVMAATGPAMPRPMIGAFAISQRRVGSPGQRSKGDGSAGREVTA